MKRFKFLSKNKISRLPATTGVYCFKQGETILYTGKAVNIKNRVKNHFQQPSYRDKLFIDKVLKAGFFETGSEIEALILEANLIKKYQPKYNVMWRDDKNYFYVAVLQNKQRIPYVFITHQIKNQKLKIKNQKLGVVARQIYIGPFTEGVVLKKTLRFLRRVFPHYTAKKHSKNKCTYCHLDLCPGPELFENPPSPEALARQREYKKNLKKLVLILRGKKPAVLSSLKQEMSRYARSGVARKHDPENRDFEKAGKIRDRLFALQRIMAHTHVINNNNKNGGFLPYGKKPHSPVLRILQKLTGAKKPISKIECYDVSNIQGKQATGSMVVFINGRPDKNQYRKFRIKFSDEPNDIAMLKEILQRRFNHPEWNYPDAILIDGGIGQLNVGIKIKNQISNIKNIKQKLKIKKIKIFALAKKNKELFMEGGKKPILLKSLPQGIYNLIIQLDDEAHRFAISYHKKLRAKKLLNR